MDNKRFYAIYDESGKYIMLDNKPHESNCIELTYDQWQEAIINECMVLDGVHTVIEVSQENIELSLYNDLRNKRDRLLQQSDWTQMPDSPLTEEKKQEWQTYRQALRDLPQTVDINNIEFPTKPQ